MSELPLSPPEPAPRRFSWTIFGAFLVAAFAINYPGRINADSLQQIIQMMVPGQLGDHHSPTVSWLWSLGGHLLGQPAGALLVHCVPFAFFAAVVPQKLDRDRWSLASAGLEAVFKLSLLISPGVIIKDILLAGLILSLLAMVQLTRLPIARRTAAIPIALIALCLLVRPTNFLIFVAAAALALPILVRPISSALRRFVVAGGILLLAVPLVAGVERVVFDPLPRWPEKQLLLFDIAGVSAITGTNQFSRLKEWPADLPSPERCYSSHEWDQLAPWGACPDYSKSYDSIAAWKGRRTFVELWLGTVAAHPVAYIQHRLSYTAHLLDPERATVGEHHTYAINRSDDLEILRRVSAGRIPEDAILMWKENGLTSAFSLLGGILHAPRGAPAAAVVLCFVILLLAWRRRRSGTAPDVPAILAASLGAGNFVMHAILGVASQDRYLFPTLCCGYLALVLALRWNSDRRPTAVAPKAQDEVGA
jgi:hypothetical protein